MRMRPLSTVLPKEMFPLGRKPMIQFAVEEAISADIDEICIVIRKGKEIIRDYFSKVVLQDSDAAVKARLPSCKITFAYQQKSDGLGGALRAARPFVGRDPFLMIIPDQLLYSARASASQQLVSQYAFDRPVVLSSMVKVPKKEVEYFRGSRGLVVDAPRIQYHRPLAISRVQSDATIHRSFIRASHEIRGFGRTIFPTAIFAYLSRGFINSKTGEIDLWKTFKEFPKKIPHYGCLLMGRACDLGTLAGYYHYLPLFLGMLKPPRCGS